MSPAAQVAPALALSPQSSGIYRIEASRKLPTIHSTKTLKNALLSPSNVNRYNRLVHRCRVLLLFSVVVATPLMSVCLLFPADLGRWTAAIATPLALLTTIVAVLALRYDMVVLLLGTFEFWYRMAALSIGAAAFVVSMRDARAVLSVNFFVSNAMLLLMDANFRGMKWQMAVSLAGALLIWLVATLVACSWIDSVHEYNVLQIYDHTITARSIIVNSFTLSGILSLHNAFVRRSFAQQPTGKSLTTTVHGVVGFASMMTTFGAVANGVAVSSPLVKTLSFASLTATVSVNLVFLCCVYELEMLRLLYTSFDFAFNVGQVFFVHLCLCDLSAWDERISAIVASFVWMHWACVIDAIPPVTREKLGFNVRRVAAVIPFAFLIALLLFSADLLAWHSQRFVNRDIIRDISYRDLCYCYC